jgi:deoxyribose-phosphate aldolase
MTCDFSAERSQMKVQTFAKLFDHSIVSPNATREEVIHAAETAGRLCKVTLSVQPHQALPVREKEAFGQFVITG